MIELFFPEAAQLVIEDVQMLGEKLYIYARGRSVTAKCPVCQTQSDKTHSRYQRHPQDLPCFGFRVQLHIIVRRFFCQNDRCGRLTFAETFPELLGYKARRTQRLSRQQLTVAFAVSGESGRCLLSSLAMPLSGDSLIRDIRRAPGEKMVTPRVLGIDDWAQRRGHTYGTILVDLESRQPVDLLNSREAEDVTAWLKQHPGVEIISRDRGHDYAKAASDGAPTAQQVADRWHLLKNLREAVATMLSHQPAALAAAAEVDEGEEVGNGDTKDIEGGQTTVTAESIEAISASVQQPTTKAERDQAARHARRQARFEMIKQLHKKGYSNRAIGRHLGMSPRTVRKCIEADVCPQYSTGRVRPSKLTPWLPYLEERWQAGYTNANQLWREIEAQGFAGSRGLVSRWAAKERKLLPQSTQYVANNRGKCAPN
jgi:transposase